MNYIGLGEVRFGYCVATERVLTMGGRDSGRKNLRPGAPGGFLRFLLSGRPMRYLLFLPLVLTGCVSTYGPRHAGPSPRLEATIDAHLAAIQNRDLDALLDTVTRGERLTLIFPDGTLFETREQYVAFHQEWFSDPDWTMTFEPIRTVESPGLATVLLRTTYEDDGPASRRQAFLSLTFADGGDGWRLVLDQNTRIPTGG